MILSDDWRCAEAPNQKNSPSQVVLSGVSSITNAIRQADILGIVNSGFFEIVLGDIRDSFRSEVILYIDKIFEHFWTEYLEFLGDIPYTHLNQWFQTEYSKGQQMNSLQGVSGRAPCALIGKLTAMEYPMNTSGLSLLNWWHIFVPKEASNIYWPCSAMDPLVERH